LWRSGANTAGIVALVLHLLLAGGLAAGRRGPARAAQPRRPRWAMLLPWALWLLAWTEIGWLYAAAPARYFDHAIGRLDLAVFGTHWNLELSRLWSGAVWREAMTAVYLSYYFLVLGPPAWLAWTGRRDAFWRHTSGLVMTYLGAFAIYLCLPVLGPRDFGLASGVATTAGSGSLLSRLMEVLFAAGDSVGTAFPSSHCAGAVGAAILCQGVFRPAVARTIAVWAALIVVATVHTNNHYAIDSLAGCVLAGLVSAARRQHARNRFRALQSRPTKEACHAEVPGHRRHRLYRTPSRVPACPGRSAAPRDGAGPA
jgi:hypothetical protein